MSVKQEASKLESKSMEQRLHHCDHCDQSFACQSLGTALAIAASEMNRWGKPFQKQGQELIKLLDESGWRNPERCQLQGDPERIRQLTDAVIELVEAVHDTKSKQKRRKAG